METRLILCQCAHYGLISPVVLQTIACSLEASGTPFELVPDLCELAARKDARLKEIARTPGARILACHARAIKALFHLAEAPLDLDRALCINGRECSADEALARLETPRCPIETPMEADPLPPARDGWIPWFPVIDAERCSNCQQCLGFCLFGVYGLSSEGKVVVENPQACKTNCPACARICPAVAIIFPKFNEAPVNGGPIKEDSGEKALVKVNLGEILGSDVYARLAQRPAKARQRRLVRDDVRLANEERQVRCEGAASSESHLLHTNPAVAVSPNVAPPSKPESPGPIS